jgi:integrase
MWVSRIVVPTMGGGSVRHEFVARTRDEVLAKLQAAKDAGAFRGGDWSLRPLRDFGAQWLRSIAPPDYKPTTIEWYKWDLERRILPKLGNVPLGKITPVVVAGFVAQLKSEGVGLAAVSRATRCLSAILSNAVAAGLMADNPVTKLVRQQRPGYAAPGAKTLTPEQLEQLLRSVGGRYAIAVAIAAMTGLRQGEILGLRWRNIDLTRGRLEVRQAVVQIGQKKYDVAPKTKSSERVVALPRSLREALQRHRKLQIAEGFGGNDHRVVTSEKGGVPDRAYLLRRVLRPALTRASLPMISWRELRHTFASATIEMDVPREALQHTLGHANLNVTLGIYDKAFRARQAIVADAWDMGFSGDKVSDKVSKPKKGVVAPRKRTKKKP